MFIGYALPGKLGDNVSFIQKLVGQSLSDRFNNQGRFAFDKALFCRKGLNFFTEQLKKTVFGNHVDFSLSRGGEVPAMIIYKNVISIFIIMDS